MYLKSIEIQGFKSFANKTELDFSRGVTGIVGPNGSGKSNISDAVRWVLGEQKIKQLRGASMQDVIFSGTQKRKPQSYAYVSITLDNADHALNLDYDELTVTRRIYRSGESEYLLNGTDCRLKDINELFYDTGIGKEGYSIIGQGQIDKILSGRAEERRALFDEAVGIVKYKRRKDVAERKLGEEQLNLQRVTDILNELGRQMEPLRRQSEQAKQYLSLRDQLILYEANLFLREMDAASKELADSSENEENVQAELASVRAESEELAKKYKEIEEKQRELEEVLAKGRSELSKSELLKTELLGQVELLREQMRSGESEKSHFRERIAALKKEEFERIAGIEDAVSVLLFIRKQIAFIRESCGKEAEPENIELDLSLIDASLKGARSVVSSCMGADYSLEERPIREAEKALPGKSDAFLHKLEEKQRELEELTKRQEALEAERREKKGEEAEFRRQFEEEQRLLQDKIRERDREKNQLELLRNLAERYEGYGHAVKSVMERRKTCPGILGVVSELLDVPGQYETAVETALAGALQNIVTGDEATAKEMVDYLKKNRLGRATFLPLPNLRSRRDENCLRAREEKGALGLGSELVHSEDRYRGLLDYLLGRILIVDRMENALSIARKYHQSIRIVTLEGELLNPGGAISGGAYRNSSNLVGRRRELSELSERLKQTEEELSRLSEKRTHSQEKLRQSGERLLHLEEELRRLELERNTSSLGIASEINTEYSTLSARTDLVTENLNRLSDQLGRLFEERAGLEDSEESFGRKAREREERIEELCSLIENTEKKKLLLEKELSLSEQRKEEILSERSSFFGRKDALSERLLLMEKEALRVQNKREKQEQRIESLTSYMLEEYDLSYQGAKERYSPELSDTKELRAGVNRLKSGIRGLGSVNLDAIGQYKEISERHSFLDRQYQDLVSSEESLTKIIRDLDSGMRRQFRENFSKIQLKFDEVFRVLFGGGQGKLSLDPEDPDVLTAGINVIAEPPGKKLQNMMQLSGGEKALTAISLLFALQSLKPSPFCLLDEIEAALDDSNVIRFAEYLNRLTDKTQFIVITHRRGTMERADRLFGITMQEKGVSTLVSVDLVQDQLEE